MSDCCEDKSFEITAMRASHGRVLWIVLVINAVMFFESALNILRQSLRAH